MLLQFWLGEQTLIQMPFESHTENLFMAVITGVGHLAMHQGHLQTSWSLNETISSLLIKWIGLLVQRRDPSHH